MEKRLAEQIQAYEKTQSQKKVHRHSPLFRRRVMVAAAVLMIAAVATSVTAVGSKSYLKEIIEKFYRGDRSGIGDQCGGYGYAGK